MKAWLPILVDELPQSPVLALSTVRNLARAGVYDRQGRLLAGSLGSPNLAAAAAEEAKIMAPGDCRLITETAQLTLECLDPDDPAIGRFWHTARQNHEGAWASWLLTMPAIEDGRLKLTRHLLSAFGPWTTPRLPEEFRDQWSLVPLKAGLGRLFIIGDDGLALETAALAARTGLTVTWFTTAEQSGQEFDEARALGDFDIKRLDGWQALTDDFLTDQGLKPGVKVVVTSPENENFLDIIKQLKPAYLALAGEAEQPEQGEAGLFPKAVTTSQKALGLVAEMLAK
ncbi:hypothetical protein LJB86_04210 [Deltaproteobacteria bacterium OttesenSCG-928-M10]|nr:hypothetical protein [Deltaproteobacteria bacterium OttesenSCG-928-M10]